MSKFDRTRELRQRFLRAAYELSDGQISKILALDEIAKEMNVDLNNPSSLDRVVDTAKYLTERGYVKRQVAGYGAISLTAAGIDEAEQAMSTPLSDVARLSEEPSSGFGISPAMKQKLDDSENLAEAPLHIQDSLERFRRDYPNPAAVAFILMRFGSTSAHESITQIIKDVLDNHGIIGVRADDKEYNDDLFSNVLTYMHGCGFGVAVFERIEAESFNPNVSLEVGYMLARLKPICLLKDQTLTSLQADLVGKLYREFDTLNPAATIPPKLSKWLSDKELSRG